MDKSLAIYKIQRAAEYSMRATTGKTGRFGRREPWGERIAIVSMRAALIPDSDAEPVVEYDPLVPEILEDPLPIHARMRTERPIYPVERSDARALARFEDIWIVSQDSAHLSNANSNSVMNLLEGKPSTLQTLASMDVVADLESQIAVHVSPSTR